ncbi:hypothetical protein TSUD_203510 [Trifolium subterraneum]|uniref:Cystatin domain-containing protein n=1 Tax=Trifolium subterraneum TaxID=3900 RepID=A0A2Z6LWH0_TRISU|nr:hypothetical protein TSUD_203510 [Trifolium subterraneum]
MMRLQSLVFLFFLLITVFSAARSVPGGWSPIDNIKDPYITEIADYAVTEYDKRSGAKLKFQKVIKGESQVVAGTNYHLTLSATDGSASTNYEAVVYVREWQNFRNLTSFQPSHD